jgi:hypothetical protein
LQQCDAEGGVDIWALLRWLASARRTENFGGD